MPVHADDYANREIVTTRVFDAPRELVFRPGPIRKPS